MEEHMNVGTGLLVQHHFENPCSLPQWVQRGYAEFQEKLLTQGFPCHFGTLAERRGELRYAYCAHDGLPTFVDTLTAFMEFARQHDDVRHALIAFFEPELGEHDFAYYRDRFWSVVNFLHRNDRHLWPNDIPTDTQDPRWEFCYGGDPIFLFVGFPAYVRRKSRNFGDGMMILFQPKRVFRGIEGATPGGIRARELIRPRLKEWDGGMEMHPDFNVIDEALAFRWKQYCASDDNSPAVGRCPFTHRDEHGRQA